VLAAADPPRGFARWLLAAGALFAILATLAALGELASSALRILEAPRARLGVAGAGVLLAGALGLAAVVAAALLAARSRLSDRQVGLVGLGLVVALRGAVLLAMDAPLANDGRAYAELARWLADGGCCFADRPTGYPALLVGAHALAGPGAASHELLNLAFAVAGGWLLYDLVREAAGRLAAALALFAFAAMPALVLLTPLLLTDTVYATLLLALCWTATRVFRDRARWAAWATATGLLLAASQYVRPIGPALLLPIAAALLLWARPARRAALAAALVVVVFGAAMLPAIGHNLSTHGDLSISTSAYGGWSLYMGTNQASKGRYNDADAEFIQSLPGANLWDQSEVAGRLGLERIGADPIGFAGLTVRKFTIMWGTEEHAVIFAFRPEGRARGALAGIDLLAQLAYLGLLLAAAAGTALVLRRGPPSPTLLLAVGLLLAQVAVHTFLEVKPRYHAQAEPLLILLAAPALAWFGTRLTAWRAPWRAPWRRT
jgi:hypothetical protein